MVEIAAGRIHIVDDDESVRDSLKFLLRLYGFEVDLHASCRDFAADFDGGRGCLLLDQHMPGMTGVEFVEGHRALLRHLPVLMMSANMEAETRDRALRAGVAGFLDKPVDTGRLLDELRRLLGGPA
ncbi:response regulator [Nitrospirillum viridazoti]|uniref:Response regulator n=1 Tax=Nitrospirillum viridazoti CBAmc TaxID=1441467 RepID=A0A248JME6_9PROT|nr:response regulator [Nitrospirillum amazonense]ASG19691.1 response regulator [Nitrospirillum amazonense CBAmc]TWB27228.1 response regulator receiver domain-containing protein [Nitrospirillum amazonense]